MRNGLVRILATASLLGSFVLPVNFARAQQQPSSIPPTTTVPVDAAPNPLGRQTQTPDEHMEELRTGLERLARSYPSQEAYMAQLRLGLERLARNINSVGN